MKKEINFTVYGPAKGKARARTINKGGKVWSYTPKKTQNYENSVKEAFLEAFDEFDMSTYSGNVKVSIFAYYEVPKSLSNKKKQELLQTPYLKKPDTDNIAKSICDALNGIAYKDDSCISELIVKKFYSETSLTIITIEYEV